MSFYLIGVDYKSALPEIRQKLLRSRSRIELFWSGIAGLDTAILVTCNRFDISIAARTENEIIVNLAWFKQEFPEFYAHSYIQEGDFKVLRYGLRLACGLESQLKGEYQILEQLEVWLNQDKFPQNLFKVWNQVIQLATEIRLNSGLYSQEVNIAKLLFEDLKNLGVGHGKLEIAVLGTGKVAGLLAEYRPGNAQLYFVAHKNQLKAEALAGRASAKVLSFDQFRQVITSLDVIVSAAGSPHIILKPADIPDLVLQRDKPLYIYDLGFPVNVAKELGRKKNIILKNLDDLATAVKDTNRYLQGNFDLAEYLIEEAVNIPALFELPVCATAQG